MNPGVGVGDETTAVLPLGVDAADESKDNRIEIGGIDRLEWLADVPIANTAVRVIGIQLGC